MKLLGISGSLREDSFNTALVKIAAASFGADEFSMGDLNLPLYSGDVESAGIPVSVQALADQIADADAVVIATPEYNKALSGVLKNALDWVSRVEGKPWAGKPVAMMSATAGRTGGEMAQASLRLCMAPFNPKLVAGPNVLVAGNFKEIEGGKLVSENYQKSVDGLMAALKEAVR